MYLKCHVYILKIFCHILRVFRYDSLLLLCAVNGSSMSLFSYRLKTLLPVLEFLFDPNIVVKHFSWPKLWESRGEHLYSFIGYIAIFIYVYGV